MGIDRFAFDFVDDRSRAALWCVCSLTQERYTDRKKNGLMSPRTMIPCILCLAASLSNVCAWAAGQGTDVQSPAVEGVRLTADEIVSHMEQRNRERSAALLRFEGMRIYGMQYRGVLGEHDAEMVIRVEASTSGKLFTVESQSGSEFVVEHIFEKLLDAEREATTDKNRERTELNTKNYAFTLASFDGSLDGGDYVLNVSPKTNDKFLYRGKIWIDSKDFAVTRIEAEPARNPSLWIKKTEISHKYEKVGDFWLPAENRTDSSIRFGGDASLSIEYKDYKIVETTASNLASRTGDGERGITGP
jgi:hypothetical protein